MDSRPEPLAFANKAIRTFVDNNVHEKCALLKEDYALIRRVFRKLGGNWEALSMGDPKHIGLLARLTKAWGAKMRDKRLTKPGEGEPIDA